MLAPDLRDNLRVRLNQYPLSDRPFGGYLLGYQIPGYQIFGLGFDLGREVAQPSVVAARAQPVGVGEQDVADDRCCAVGLGPAEHRRQRWSRDHGQRPNSGDRSASALAVRRCRSTGSEGGRMQCLASTPGRSAGTRASSQAAAPAPEEYGPGVAVQGWNLAARKLPLPPVGNCSEIVKLFAPVPKQNLALARPVELLAVQKLFRLQC